MTFHKALAWDHFCQNNLEMQSQESESLWNIYFKKETFSVYFSISLAIQFNILIKVKYEVFDSFISKCSLNLFESVFLKLKKNKLTD